MSQTLPSVGVAGWEDREEGSLDADGVLAALGAWAGERRVEEAADARVRERWLRQQALESATLSGVLLDLAERRRRAVLVVGTRLVRGRVVGVGVDACVLADEGGTATIVALAHLLMVRGLDPGVRTASGGRAPAAAWRLLDALEALAAERSPVRLGLLGGQVASGSVVNVGLDVVGVGEGGRGPTTYVALRVVETITPA